MSSSEQGRAFGGIIDVLEALGMNYAIWGGRAVIVHGEPRFTQDMDLLLHPQDIPVSLFIRRLQELHYHVDEVAVRNALTGGFFKVIHLHYLIKTDFWVVSEPLHFNMIAERIYLPFDEMRSAAFVTPAALIHAKLQAFKNSESSRHLDDIGSVIRIQGEDLDVAALDHVAAQLGLLGVWRRLVDENRRPD